MHVDSSSAPLAPGAAEVTRARSDFRSHLARGLRTASDVAAVAGAVVPGAGLVSVALGGLSRVVGPAAASSPGRNGPGVETMLAESRSLNLQYLMLQERVQRESREFTALSNLMRARHETVRNMLANLR